MSTSLDKCWVSEAAALALMHPVRPGRADHLQETLQDLSPEDIAAMRGEEPLYAAQWVLFDHDTRLLCTVHFQGKVKALFRDLATYGTEKCRRIWGNCMGYPDGEKHSIDGIVAYLAAGQVPVTAAFPRRHVQDITDRTECGAFDPMDPSVALKRKGKICFR